jgi:hypothetical protein
MVGCWETPTYHASIQPVLPITSSGWCLCKCHSQQCLILAARHWLARHGEVPCRFDCVLFDGQQLTWLKNAFTAD